jgi:hypothetical protein
MQPQPVPLSGGGRTSFWLSGPGARPPHRACDAGWCWPGGPQGSRAKEDGRWDALGSLRRVGGFQVDGRAGRSVADRVRTPGQARGHLGGPASVVVSGRAGGVKDWD